MPVKYGSFCNSSRGNIGEAFISVGASPVNNSLGYILQPHHYYRLSGAQPFSSTSLTMAERFSSIPILEYDDAVSPTSRPRFLSALRHALVNVGFFYLRNPPIEVEVQEALVQKSASFFNLPVAKKQEVAISNSKQFRGYASLASEETGMKSDARETFTVRTI